MNWSSEQIDKIAPAFLKAQRDIKGAKKDSKNPHLKSNYADLGSVFDACKDTLNENGISIMQLLGNKDGKNTLKTILMHESGQYFGDEAFLPEVDQKGINAAQAMGSAISYMKRYELQSATGVISEDDDGNAAGNAGGQKTDEPAKDVAHWKAQADKNTAHIVNLKNWYKKYQPEIRTLTKAQQDEINLHVKALSEKLEKELADKKAAEAQPDAGKDAGTSEADALAKDAERGSGAPPPDEKSDIEPF